MAASIVASTDILSPVEAAEVLLFIANGGFHGFETSDAIVADKPGWSDDEEDDDDKWTSPLPSPLDMLVWLKRQDPSDFVVSEDEDDESSCSASVDDEEHGERRSERRHKRVKADDCDCEDVSETFHQHNGTASSLKSPPRKSVSVHRMRTRSKRSRFDDSNEFNCKRRKRSRNDEDSNSSIAYERRPVEEIGVADNENRREKEELKSDFDLSDSSTTSDSRVVKLVTHDSMWRRLHLLANDSALTPRPRVCPKFLYERLFSRPARVMRTLAFLFVGYGSRLAIVEGGENDTEGLRSDAVIHDDATDANDSADQRDAADKSGEHECGDAKTTDRLREDDEDGTMSEKDDSSSPGEEERIDSIPRVGVEGESDQDSSASPSLDDEAEEVEHLPPKPLIDLSDVPYIPDDKNHRWQKTWIAMFRKVEAVVKDKPAGPDKFSMVSRCNQKEISWLSKQRWFYNKSFGKSIPRSHPLYEMHMWRRGKLVCLGALPSESTKAESLIDLSDVPPIPDDQNRKWQQTWVKMFRNVEKIVKDRTPGPERFCMSYRDNQKEISWVSKQKWLYTKQLRKTMKPSSPLYDLHSWRREKLASMGLFDTY